MKSEKDKLLCKMQKILKPQIEAARRKANGYGGLVWKDAEIELQMFEWFYKFIESHKDERSSKRL